MSFEKLYTVDDVAAYTSLTSRTIRNYLKDGTLKGHKVGGQWRFTMQNINDLMESNSAKKEIVSTNDQFLLDFIGGVNTDVTGELQICTIADYYCANAPEATALHREFSAMLADAVERDDTAKYLYHYKEDERKARYTFLGTPETVTHNVGRLERLWNEVNESKRHFLGRSSNYLSGRPDYPAAFFDYLYGEFGMTSQSVIADIGSGIGTMSKHFLERGNTVYCIEPNTEMKALSDQLLGSFKGYHSRFKTAEDTGLNTGSVDFIVCGNAFGAFDRQLALPEFQRILKKGGKLIITHYYPDKVPASDEMNRLWSEFKSAETLASDQLIGKEFAEGKAVHKEFIHTYQQDFSRFLAGCLSSAIAPKVEDERYDAFVNRLKDIFDQYSTGGKLECKFKLICLIGGVDDLA